ncbi:U3 small nucleolar RNA-associated protein 14 homolog A [Harpegnathos saltator]|uniref:U3 small nucleolar RNA-associated protein 14-like protein A n=1 Tax=Harpegnathos saltator TaxID=610380 RepID=E2B486_HARSA|nr:U3 small nucleolar RNA-associated protein 14 homolog A [Harpegnathos saltator]EFN89503.1 U3 small nucleolar RNA-associated protein 14-like protein A [Harpegnathos saltator]
MDNLEIAYDSDQEVSQNHSKFLEAVTQLDKKKRMDKAKRSEPTLEVSEFHLVKSGITNKNAVYLPELVSSLGQKGYQSQITKKLRSIQQKSKPISKPLEKPSAERVKMKFGFERTLKDLGKWNAIVARNRTATQLSFPLNTSKKKLKINPLTEFSNGFRLKSNLQQKLEALEPKPKELSTKENSDNKDEKKEERNKMTLEDVKTRRNKLARLRAQQSYKEAKAQRLRKIKSKKFHRIERKKKIKEQLIEFEELQKTNPEEALARLEQLDKSRAQERMSLRHKSTGQWAKNKQIRAKYDKETRQVLAEQLSIGRELTQKVAVIEDTDEDEESEAPFILPSNNKKICNEKTETKMKNKQDTETTSSGDVEKLECNKESDSKTSETLKAIDVDDMFDSMLENIRCKVDLKMQKIKKNLETESKVNKLKKEKNKKKKNSDYIPSLEFKESKQKPILDLPLEETISLSRENSQQDIDLTGLKTLANTEQEPANEINGHTADVNMQNYAQTEPQYLKTQVPDLDTGGEDVMDDSEQEEETQDVMDEAFADDEFAEEFRKEKEEEIKNSQPQDIDKSLPGWGKWAGTNIMVRKTRRKNKRFIVKFPKDAPRKDENKGDVIIFEGANQKLKEHLVSELPYPFTTVQDFEASIRAPLGRSFVPENAHRRLIQPSVVTKSGQVIEPMTEDVLVEKQPSVKRRIDKQKKKSMKNKKRCE